MRFLYSLLLYLILPGVLLRLWIKGRRVPGYRRHWSERFGLDAPRAEGMIWLHAVSVGEVRAAEPLIRALLARYPGRALLVTVTTPTGRRTVAQLFGDTVMCRYLPYDLPGALRRFLDAVHPVALIVMELELWPNLYAALAARGVALYLVNARLSEKSFRAYRRGGALMRETLAAIGHIAAQSEADRSRFARLGMDPARMTVTGNLKAEVSLPEDFAARVQALRRVLSGRHPVWMAASTHAGEEASVLEAHVKLLERYPGALLILAPRHPERAANVARQCRGKGLSCRFSSESSPGEAAVLIVDQLGVLARYYAVAGVAFVGGSLVSKGGHNPLEALVAGTPVISGPHVDNFADIYMQLQDAGAAAAIDSAEALAAAVAAWFADGRARDRAISAGQEIVAGYRGALERVLALVDPGR